MGPTEQIVKNKYIFIIDTGYVYDSYFCDFDRNYSFGAVTDETKKSLRNFIPSN